MGAADVEAFLAYLAVQRHVSASTQNQAKSAFLYLYKKVLGVELPLLDKVTEAKLPQCIPVVLTQAMAKCLCRWLYIENNLAHSAIGVCNIVFHRLSCRLVRAVK